MNCINIGSDNGLSPGRRQAIIWTNAGILLIWTLGTNFNEILSEIHIFPFKKLHLKMSSAKWLPFCPGGDGVKDDTWSISYIWISMVDAHGYLASAAILLTNTASGVGLISQFLPFRYFPNFSALSKHTLVIEYYVYIWQVSPLLSCGVTCQI